MTQVTYPVPGNGNNTTIATHAQYDAASGLLLSTTDPNNQTTTYRYYDRLLRPVEIDFPDGGKTTYSYPSTTEQSVSQLQQGATSLTTVSDLDAYGRQSQTTLPNGAFINYTYYPNGAVHTVTNPHLSSSSATDGTTTYVYDALGRTTSVTLPDGATQGWSYNSNTATKQDEAGHQWQYTVDGLGRTTKVIEPNSAETDYAYGGFMTTVSQKGVSGETPRSDRVFTSDSLGRTVSVSAPESGTTTYGYDNNGNLTSMADARGITTGYTYDALNRLTNKQSAAGTGIPGFNYTYGYDSSSSAVNGIGRLVWATNSTNADEVFSYDVMGRLNWQSSWTPSSPNHTGIITTANYDLAGNLTDLTYPDGRHIKQSRNNAGQLTQVSDANNGYQYLTPNSSYWPNGSPQSIWYGNGVAVGYHLNNRSQVDEIGSTRIGTSAPGSYTNQTALSVKHYCFGPATPPLSGTIAGCPALASANNGNIWQVQDSLNDAKTQTFGYDNLNRLNSFVSNDRAMQQTYAYDSFGNMNQTVPGTLQSNLTFGANNQIIGNGYDAAGNVTSYNNGASTFAVAYDAENKLVNFNNTATYTYDANHDRVRKDASGDWTEYVHFNGQAIAEKHSDGTWSDYIFANGQMIARADNYDVRIHLSGTNCSNCGSNPNMYVGVTSLTAANGYTIRNGDVLTWRQYQSGATTGGIILYFTDHTDATGTARDTDGQPILQDATMNAWHMRTVDLSPYAGKTIQLVDPFQWTAAPAGSWDLFFGDISLVSTDGSVIPIYSRTTQTLSTATNPTVSNFNAITEKVPDSTPITTTTYYHGDQVGSTLLMTAGGGWPVSSDTFYPFGQEQSATSTVNRYKFAGLERDDESKLDHAQFRQYSSTQGRWLSPDPYSGSYRISDPQSFNRYAYVLNNPLVSVDPSGLADCYTITKQWVNPTANNGHGDEGTSTYTYCSDRGGSLPWYITEYGGPGCGAVAAGQPAQSCQTIIYPDKPTTAPNTGRRCIANCGKPAPSSNLPNCYALAAQTVADDLNIFNPGVFSLFDPIQSALGQAAVGQAQRAALYGVANGMRYRATKLAVRSMLQTSSKLGALANAIPWISFDLMLVDAIHTELTQPCTV